MATSDQNLSQFNLKSLGDCSQLKIGLVVSQWNKKVTGKLLTAAEELLSESKVKSDNIFKIEVPGSFELVAGAKIIASQHPLDAVICLGCVIQGETRHFEFICQAVANGLINLNIAAGIPFVFGVLTTEDMTQALDRAGGKHGNKGSEAAFTALKMAMLKQGDWKNNEIGFTG